MFHKKESRCRIFPTNMWYSTKALPGAWVALHPFLKTFSKCLKNGFPKSKRAPSFLEKFQEQKQPSNVARSCQLCTSFHKVLSRYLSQIKRFRMFCWVYISSLSGSRQIGKIYIWPQYLEATTAFSGSYWERRESVVWDNRYIKSLKGRRGHFLYCSKFTKAFWEFKRHFSLVPTRKAYTQKAPFTKQFLNHNFLLNGSHEASDWVKEVLR